MNAIKCVWEFLKYLTKLLAIGIPILFILVAVYAIFEYIKKPYTVGDIVANLSNTQRFFSDIFGVVFHILPPVFAWLFWAIILLLIIVPELLTVFAFWYFLRYKPAKRQNHFLESGNRAKAKIISANRTRTKRKRFLNVKYVYLFELDVLFNQNRFLSKTKSFIDEVNAHEFQVGDEIDVAIDEQFNTMILHPNAEPYLLGIGGNQLSYTAESDSFHNRFSGWIDRQDKVLKNGISANSIIKDFHLTELIYGDGESEKIVAETSLEVFIPNNPSFIAKTFVLLNNKLEAQKFGIGTKLQVRCDKSRTNRVFVDYN